MKLFDIIHQFKAEAYSINDGLCRVRMFINSKNKVNIVVTDLGDLNPSASVTNGIEKIKQSLLQSGIIPDEVSFIEHYEKDSYDINSFDLVTFDKKGDPSWTTIIEESVIKLLECSKDEFGMPTEADKRLMAEIDRIRYKMDPKIDFPYPEDPEVLKRRAKISAASISKQSIIDLVNMNAKEQEISRLLKQDLSIFGEIYSHPNEEYICFSEFPIEDGYVDYVVFTGRSRMDIYLVEVKGADFNLVTKGSYKKFASKIEEASGQLRDRLSKIQYDYKSYRIKFHEIREKVESNERIYNSFVGPKGNLQVDPNKDVNIYPVLIGGRTGNDLEESRKRQAFEYNTKPTIKLETWDTWLRKLRRL